MKKTLFILGLLLSVAFLYAQNFNYRTSAYAFDEQEVDNSFAPSTSNCISPKSFKIELDNNCIATLKWHAPTEMLYNQEQAYTNVYPSSRWLLQQEEMSRDIIADSFVVPEGEEWIVTEVAFGGTYNVVSGGEPHQYEAPDFIGVAIYFDNGDGLPGAKIHEDEMLSPIIGNTNGKNRVLLSEPVVLSLPGKYWVSCYGSYYNTYDKERTYYVYINVADEFSMAGLDQTSGPEWEEFEGASMYFSIFGPKNSDPIKYNIYLNDQIIASEITGVTFNYDNFDYTKQNTWSISTACPEGGESTLVYAITKPCTVGIDEESMEFTIAPNPATNQIKITAECIFNKVEVINFLGQTVISQSNAGMFKTTIDISNLNSGVYFVRMISDTGTSARKFVKE